MKAEGETAYEPHILLRMEAVKPRKTNALATIVAYAEKDRTGVLSGRSFASPDFTSICGPLLGLLGATQAQMKSADETASDDAEANERADHDFAAHSAELVRTFSARMDLANAAALKKIGDGITPQIKAKMLPADLATVRDKYHRRLKEIPIEPPHIQILASSSPMRWLSPRRRRPPKPWPTQPAGRRKWNCAMQRREESARSHAGSIATREVNPRCCLHRSNRIVLPTNVYFLVLVAIMAEPWVHEDLPP
jgi:hypothetical protein